MTGAELQPILEGNHTVAEDAPSRDPSKDPSIQTQPQPHGQVQGSSGPLEVDSPPSPLANLEGPFSSSPSVPRLLLPPISSAVSNSSFPSSSDATDSNGTSCLAQLLDKNPTRYLAKAIVSGKFPVEEFFSNHPVPPSDEVMQEEDTLGLAEQYSVYLEQSSSSNYNPDSARTNPITRTITAEGEAAQPQDNNLNIIEEGRGEDDEQQQSPCSPASSRVFEKDGLISSTEFIAKVLLLDEQESQNQKDIKHSGSPQQPEREKLVQRYLNHVAEQQRQIDNRLNAAIGRVSTEAAAESRLKLREDRFVDRTQTITGYLDAAVARQLQAVDAEAGSRKKAILDRIEQLKRGLRQRGVVSLPEEEAAAHAANTSGARSPSPSRFAPPGSTTTGALLGSSRINAKKFVESSAAPSPSLQLRRPGIQVGGDSAGATSLNRLSASSLTESRKKLLVSPLVLAPEYFGGGGDTPGTAVAPTSTTLLEDKTITITGATRGASKTAGGVEPQVGDSVSSTTGGAALVGPSMPIMHKPMRPANATSTPGIFKLSNPVSATATTMGAGGRGLQTSGPLQLFSSTSRSAAPVQPAAKPEAAVEPSSASLVVEPTASAKSSTQAGMKQDSQSKEANIKHQATSSTSTSTTSRKNPHLLPGVTDTAASSIPASSKKVNGTIGKASSKGTTSKMSKNPQAHEDEHEQFKGSAAFAVMLVRDQPDYSTKASRGPKKHDPKRITSEAHMEGAGLLNERAFLHGRGMLVPPVGIHLDKAVKGEELDHRGHAYHECASPFYMPNVSEEQKQEWRRIVEENKHFLQDFQQEVELAEDIKQRRGQLETEDVVGLGGIGRGGRSSPSKSKNLASATPNTRSVDQEEVDDDTEDARLQAVEEVGTSSSGEDSGTHVKIGHVAMHKKDFTETLKRHIRPKSSTPSPNRKNKTDQEVDDLKSTSDVLSITGRGVLEERAEQENGVGDDVSVRSGGISPRAIEAKWRKSGASVLPLLDELEKEDDPGDLREKILLPTSPLFRRELFKKAHKVLQKVKLRQHVAAYEQQENVKYTRLFMTCVKELALTRAREKEQERWRQELLQEEAERREQELANGNASGAAVVGSTNRSKNTTPGGSGAAVLPRGDRSRSPSPHAAVGGGSLGASTTSTHIHHGHHHGHHKHVKTSEQQEDAAEGRANRRSKERVSLLAEYQDELDGLEAITVTPRGGTHVVDIEAAKRIHRSLSADQSLKKLAEAAKQTEEYKLRKMSQQHQKEHGLLQNGSGAFQPAQRSVLLGQNMNLGSLVPALKSAAGQSGFLATKALASRTGVAGAPSSMMQLQQEDGQNNIFSPVTSKETVSNAGSPGGSREVVDTEDTFTVSNPLLIMKDSLDPVNKGAAKKNLGNGLVPFPKKLDMPGGVGISTKTAAGATTEVPSLQDHIRMNKFISVKSTSQNCGGALAPTSAARLQLNLGDLGLGRGGAGIASSNVSILGNSVGVVPGSGPVIAENNMSMMPVSAPVSARGERHVVPITGAGTLTPMLKPLPLFATPQPTAFKTAAQAEAPLRSSSPSSANQQGKKDADRSSSTTRRLLLLDQKLEANFESFMPQGSPFAKAGAGQRSAQNDSMQLGASASTASLQPGSGSMTAFLSNAYMRAKNEAAGKSASARGAALEGQQQRDKTASSAMSSARAPTLLRADSFRNDLSARGRGLSINRLDPGQAPGVSTDPFRGQVIAGTICKVNVTSTSPGSGHHGVTTTSFSPQTSKLLFTKLPGDEGMKDIKDKFQKVMSGLTQPIVPNWTGEAPSS